MIITRVFLSPSLRSGDKLHYTTCIELYFFLTECVKLAFLFVLHAQSRCFRHGVRKSKLICKCAIFAHAVYKQLLCARKTSTKRRVSHTPFQKIIFNNTFEFKVFYSKKNLFISFGPQFETKNIL